MMPGKLGRHLYACGEEGLPPQIVFGGSTYRLNKILKHDFFAATSLYEFDGQSQAAGPAKIILKLGRRQYFLGLPLLWLGQCLCAHELSILSCLGHLRGVPYPLARYGKTGFIYEYIEGQSLDEVEKLPDDFFDELLELLRQIHRLDIVYLDMNKRGNILLGSDGLPYLIDFQISLHLPRYMLILRRFSAYLRETLQRADLYHLFKHKRRLCPESLRPNEQILSCCVSGFIRLHRLIATPLRKLRRNFMKYLYVKGIIVAGKDTHYSRENDPARFAG